MNITGTMTTGHAAKLCRLLDRRDEMAWDGWGEPYACLSFNSVRPGLCGLGSWPATQVDRTGNLAERDYSIEDVADALRALVAVAPSMLLKVHCGGEYESNECVATISVGEGLVVVGKPEREATGEIPEGQMIGNLMQNLMR